MPNFSAYVRVSDDKLKDDGSRRQDIERQKKLLEPLLVEFQRTHPDWKRVDWFNDDAKSAWTDDISARPAFASMMGEIKANRLHWVFLEDLTRFARLQGWGLVWLSDCAKHNCNIESLHAGEHEVTSIAGWLKNSVIFMLGELESRVKSSKVTSGMDDRRNNPNAVCGSCNIVHMGRHPKNCTCTVTKACRERRDSISALEKNKERVVRFVAQNLKPTQKTG